jgi:hypothetical protein
MQTSGWMPMASIIVPLMVYSMAIPCMPEFVIPTLGGICQHLLQRIAHCSII